MGVVAWAVVDLAAVEWVAAAKALVGTERAEEVATALEALDTVAGEVRAQVKVAA